MPPNFIEKSERRYYRVSYEPLMDIIGQQVEKHDATTDVNFYGLTKKNMKTRSFRDCCVAHRKNSRLMELSLATFFDRSKIS